MKSILAGIAALASVVSATGELALYWGQNSQGGQQSLGYYCENTDASIFIMSFLNDFGTSPTNLNLANACGMTFTDSTLLHCPSVAADIQKCQSLGKKVVLSLGGVYGSYGFSSDSQATAYADTLWNMFGGGNATQRPFNAVKVDGFDLDIENNNPTGYGALISRLRTLFATDTSKSYTISGSPQCVYPDASLGPALASSWFDYVFVQFYNNACGITGSFNWASWASWASTTSANKNVKLFAGVLGSPSAGSGYATPSQLSSQITPLLNTANFGGISIWDASQAIANTDGSETYAHAAYLVLNPPVSSSVAPAASATGADPNQNNKGANTDSAVSATSTSGNTDPTSTSASSKCTEGATACVNGVYGVCNGKSEWVLYRCPDEASCQIRDGNAQCIVTVTECAAPQKRGLHHVHMKH
jgi:chitinase